MVIYFAMNSPQDEVKQVLVPELGAEQSQRAGPVDEPYQADMRH